MKHSIAMIRKNELSHSHCLEYEKSVTLQCYTETVILKNQRSEVMTMSDILRFKLQFPTLFCVSQVTVAEG